MEGLLNDDRGVLEVSRVVCRSVSHMLLNLTGRAQLGFWFHRLHVINSTVSDVLKVIASRRVEFSRVKLEATRGG